MIKDLQELQGTLPAANCSKKAKVAGISLHFPSCVALDEVCLFIRFAKGTQLGKFSPALRRFSLLADTALPIWGELSRKDASPHLHS